MRFILLPVLLTTAVAVESKKSEEVLKKCVGEAKISLEDIDQLGKTLKGKSDDDLKSLRDAAKGTIGEEKVAAFMQCMKTNIEKLLDKCVKNVTVTDEEKTKLDEAIGTILESSGGSRKAAADKVVEILGPARAETLGTCARKELSD